MRAIWQGAVTFGLVNVPVKLYAATSDHDIKFHQIHDADKGRIHYERRCEVCGQIVDSKHIEKAFVEQNKTVVITKEDFASIPQENNHEIEVMKFIPTTQLDPVLLDKSYYLTPQKNALKAYELLKETLNKTKLTAIVSFALRQKTRLAALRVRNKVLVVQTMLWPDEVREPDFDFLDNEIKISAKELTLSQALVKQYSKDPDLDQYRDKYQEELRALIAKKLRNKKTTTTSSSAPTETNGEVIDLMQALRDSIKNTRTNKKGKNNGKHVAAK